MLCLVRATRIEPGYAKGSRIRVSSPPRGASLKCRASSVDNVGMMSDLLNQGLSVTLMLVVIASLWIAGIWTLVKDERGPAVLFTRLLLVGFVIFLACWFAFTMIA